MVQVRRVYRRHSVGASGRASRKIAGGGHKPMYGLISVSATAAVEAALVSSAHCWTAPSIWRRLLMQAFSWIRYDSANEIRDRDSGQETDDATTIMISNRA